MKVIEHSDAISYCEADPAQVDLAVEYFAPLARATGDNAEFLRREYRAGRLAAYCLKDETGTVFATIFGCVVFSERFEAAAGVSMDKSALQINKILLGIEKIAKSMQCRVISLSTRRFGLAKILPENGYDFAGLNFTKKLT